MPLISTRTLKAVRDRGGSMRACRVSCSVRHRASAAEGFGGVAVDGEVVVDDVGEASSVAVAVGERGGDGCWFVAAEVGVDGVDELGDLLAGREEGERLEQGEGGHVRRPPSPWKRWSKRVVTS